MKIVGKIKKDYYDSGAQYGQDPNLLLIRNPEEIQYAYGGNPVKTGLEEYHPDRRPILFCGKAYPRLICTQYDFDDQCVRQDPAHTVSIYTVPAMDKFLSTNTAVSKLMRQAMYGRKWNRGRTYYDMWAEYLSNGPYTVPDTLFIKHKTPYMVISEKYWESHNPFLSVLTFPLLEDYGFNKIVPANQAWQEIEMYLSNVLVTERNPPVVIRDIDKVAKHGFNEKSFRKEKQS